MYSKYLGSSYPGLSYSGYEISGKTRCLVIRVRVLPGVSSLCTNSFWYDRGTKYEKVGYNNNKNGSRHGSNESADQEKRRDRRGNQGSKQCPRIGNKFKKKSYTIIYFVYYNPSLTL